MERNSLSPQEQEFRRRHVAKVAQHLDINDVMVLYYLYRTQNSSESKNRDKSSSAVGGAGIDVQKITIETGLNISAVRLYLSRLELIDFAEKTSMTRPLKYAITDEGRDALNYLLSTKYYPGRKDMVTAALDRGKR